ncbi:MAG: Ig-like domain-containing protein [Candidatus Thorarchaeota archaeon]
MHTKKKISIFVVSLALVLALLNVASQVALESGVDGIGVVESAQHYYYPSGVIGDNDVTGPIITIALTGAGTDGDPGTWTVSAEDPESGVDSISVEIDSIVVGTSAGTYTVPNSLGLHSIIVTATNADFDGGPGDQETSTSSDAVNIVDDDITGPSIFITYVGDATDVNPGFWNVIVFDTISGIDSIVVEVDGVGVGTIEGDYDVPSSAGDHTINVTAHNNDLDREADQETSILLNTVTIVETTPPGTSIELSGETTGAYSDPVYLEARLIDVLTGVPIPGKWIVFTVGTQTVEAITDSSGIASYILLLDQQSGVYTLSASFAGDDDYSDSSATCEFVIAKEYAHVAYTGRTIIPTSDDTITLMATIFDEDDGYWGDLTKIYVTFTLYLSSDAVFDTGPIMVETTDVEGVGLAIVEIPNLAAGEYLVVVSFNHEDNSYYYGPDSDATITVYEPKRGSAKGAGWIRDEAGNKVFFVFNVKYNGKGTLKGFLFLILRVNEEIYFVRSTDILSFTTDGNHAFFEAECRIGQYKHGKHWRHWKHWSGETYRIRVDVWDNKKSHEDDVFQIRIFDKNGLVEYEAGFDPYGYVIRGNIKVRDHWKKRRCWF